MSGSRGRKWTSGQNGRWRTLHWVDRTVFKVEQEADSLTDKCMEDWGVWMDSQIEKKFGDEWPPLTAGTLNFSRNELGDEGVRCVVDYLCRQNISVKMVKFFKNAIGDAGARAIGQLLAQSSEPVHEVHLSHNRISERGALSIFSAIARSGRFPYASDRAGRRDPRGLTPVWLRMEYNCISWGAIEQSLEQQQVRWCAAESRDGWSPKDRAPMVCVHQSYRNQPKAEAAAAPALLRPPAPEVRPKQPASAGVGEVPMYVFLDASAVKRMLRHDDGGLLSFEGLLNLCHQGHMNCTPPAGQQHPPPWFDPGKEEHERLIFVVTDTVLDEVYEYTERHQGERKLLELRRKLEAHLEQCHSWGILEILQTRAHRQLMINELHEPHAREMGIPKRASKLFDFVCLWESQIESEGRVAFITDDKVLCRFCCESCPSAPSGGPSVAVLHADDCIRRLLADQTHGGALICDAAWRRDADDFCGAVLSAPLMVAVVISAAPGDGGGGRGRASSSGGRAEDRAESRAETKADKLRRELQEAMVFFQDARQVLKDGDEEVVKCFKKIDDAGRRWQALIHAH